MKGLNLDLWTSDRPQPDTCSRGQQVKTTESVKSERLRLVFRGFLSPIINMEESGPIVVSDLLF